MWHGSVTARIRSSRQVQTSVLVQDFLQSQDQGQISGWTQASVSAGVDSQSQVVPMTYQSSWSTVGWFLLRKKEGKGVIVRVLGSQGVGGLPVWWRGIEITGLYSFLPSFFASEGSAPGEAAWTLSVHVFLVCPSFWNLKQRRSSIYLVRSRGLSQKVQAEQGLYHTIVLAL